MGGSEKSLRGDGDGGRGAIAAMFAHLQLLDLAMLTEDRGEVLLGAIKGHIRDAELVLHALPKPLSKLDDQRLAILHAHDAQLCAGSCIEVWCARRARMRRVREREAERYVRERACR